MYTIQCDNEIQFINFCCEFTKKGFHFKAAADKLIIELTGGF